MKEIWKDIKGFKGYYQVSNLGRVRSLERKITRSRGGEPHEMGISSRVLKPGWVGGYPRVVLSRIRKRETKCIHRMVAEYFIKGRTKTRNHVNHIDGNKSNNSSDNLEWCSQKENNNHAQINGLSRWARGGQSGMAKLTERQVSEIRGLILIGFILVDIASTYKISPEVISQIKHNRIWKHVPWPNLKDIH